MNPKVKTRRRRPSVLSRTVNVKVRVPNDLKGKMDRLADVDWSKIARQAFEETLRKTEFPGPAQEEEKLHGSSARPIPRPGRKKGAGAKNLLEYVRSIPPGEAEEIAAAVEKVLEERGKIRLRTPEL